MPAWGFVEAFGLTLVVLGLLGLVLGVVEAARHGEE